MRELVRIPDGVGEGPTRKNVLSAYVTPQEILDHKEQGWRAYSVADVPVGSWKGGGIPVPARAYIGPKQVEWLEEYHEEAELQVVFVPKELALQHEELFNKVMAAITYEHAERRKSRRWSAKRAQCRAERLVCQCVALVQNLQHIPVSAHHVTRDPIVVQLLTECKEALADLMKIMGPINRDLLSGASKRLGELRGLPESDDRSAHCAFRYAVEATWYLHHLSLLGLKLSGAMSLFLAALFINVGLLAHGEVTAENHAAWSAYIYELLREQKPSLPSDVGDLIGDHGQWWPWNAGMRVVIDDGKGSPESQRRVYGPDNGVKEGVVLPDDGGSVAIQPMDSTYIGFVLILSVVEQVVDRSMQGESETGVLASLVDRMQTSAYDLASGDKDQTMLTWVLAAALNAHRVTPCRAVVAFGKKGEVPSGRPIAISLGHHGETRGPLVLVVTREGSGMMLAPTTSIRAMLEHSKASLRTATTQLLLGFGSEPESSVWLRAGSQVIGFVSRRVYQTLCHEVESRLVRILPQLKELR